MQLFVAAQLPHKVHQKVSTYGPRSRPGQLSSVISNVVELYDSHLKDKKGMTERKVVPKSIWQTSYKRADDRSGSKKPAPPRSYPTEKNKPVGGKNPKEETCFNCGKTGHFRKDCRLCAYCKVAGHKAADCSLRKAESVHKKCKHCNTEGNHNTSECRKRLRKINPASVNLTDGINESVDENQDEETQSANVDEAWDTNVDDLDDRFETEED
jgi:hypothetical protein